MDQVEFVFENSSKMYSGADVSRELFPSCYSEQADEERKH